MTRTNSGHAVAPPRRGALDATLALLLLYAVWSRTPCGALPVFALRAYQGLPTPDLLATFRGRETDVRIEPPVIEQGLVREQNVGALLNAAAESSGTNAELLASVLSAEIGSCRGAGCLLDAPPRLADALPHAASLPEVSLLELAQAIATARTRLGTDELGLEALYVGVVPVERALLQARASGLQLPDDVEVHGQFFSAGIRRGPLQGALRVLAIHRLRTLAWPADERWPVTSRYGMRMHPVLRETRLHNGTDIAAPVGEPIYSAHQGVVVRRGRDSVNGNWIKVAHGFGIESTYCHLHDVSARAGERVARKQGIGSVGATGRVTGPHLHYVLRVAGDTVDAERYGGAPREKERGASKSTPLTPMRTTPVSSP